MSIPIRCAACGSQFIVKDSSASRRVACRNCRAPIRVPAPAEQPRDAAADRPARAIEQPAPNAGQQQSPADDERITVACPGCANETRVRRLHIGNRVRCKHCDEVFRITLPAQEESAPRGLPEPPRREPAPIARPRQQQEDVLAALEDLGGVGLAPLASATAAPLPALRLSTPSRAGKRHGPGSEEFTDKILGILLLLYTLAVCGFLAVTYSDSSAATILYHVRSAVAVPNVACFILALVRMLRQGSTSLGIFCGLSLFSFFAAHGSGTVARSTGDRSFVVVAGVLALFFLIGQVVGIVVSGRNSDRWHLQRVMPIWALFFAATFISGFVYIGWEYQERMFAKQSPGQTTAPMTAESGRPPSPQTATSRTSVPSPTAGANPVQAAPSNASTSKADVELMREITSDVLQKTRRLRDVMVSIVDRESAQRASSELMVLSSQIRLAGLRGRHIKRTPEIDAIDRQLEIDSRGLRAEIERETQRIKTLQAQLQSAPRQIPAPQIPRSRFPPR